MNIGRASTSRAQCSRSHPSNGTPAMNSTLVPYGPWEIIEALLPPEPPRQKGGRRRVPDLVGVGYCALLLKILVLYASLYERFYAEFGSQVSDCTQRCAT